MFSVKRLSEHLGITKSQAREVRAILELDLKRGVRSEREVDTPEYVLRYRSASRKLYMIASAIDGFNGVECIDSVNDTFTEFNGIEYLNSGDSYGATIMYDFGKGKWLLSSWGDVVERHPKRFGHD